MYLKKIYLENVGPIQKLSIDMPFTQDENPKPVVFVGSNGSGKTILLSFIINYYLTVKQEFYDNAEVEKGKVYKLRSPQYIQSRKHYYYAQLEFESGFKYEEWQLDRTRKEFEESLQFSPNHKSWNSIPITETSAFLPDYRRNNGHISHEKLNSLKELLDKNVTLYFPSDRFEQPAWLNEQHLNFKANVIFPKRLKNLSDRQILVHEVLDLLVNWFFDTYYESCVVEREEAYVIDEKNNNTSVKRILRHNF